MYYISLFEGSGRFILSLPRSIEDRFHTVFHRVVNPLGLDFVVFRTVVVLVLFQ